MTDEAETPPEQTPDATSPTTLPELAANHESRIAQLETDLKHLAEIGKNAYDSLDARIARFESPLSPVLPDHAAPISRTGDKVPRTAPKA